MKNVGSLKDFFLRIWWYFLAYFIALVYVIRELIFRKFTGNKGLKGVDLEKQDGRIAVVTGGSRGIGLEIVNYLLDFGYSVVIGSSAGDDSRGDLESSLRKSYPHATVEVWYLDLASLSSVKKFAEKFLSSGRQLNLLINNAGIMFMPHEVTEDGFERHFSINYLSHFLLTTLLLPILEESGTKERKSRIINSTSCIHYVGNLNMDDLQGMLNYSKHFAYMQSKLAQVMFTFFLHSFINRTDSNVTVNCCHPGIVNTELMQCVWWAPYVARIFFKSSKEGAETTIYAALSKEMEGIGGKYLEECSVVDSSRLSKDENMQKALWNQSLQYLKPWLNNQQYTRMEIS